MPHHIQTPLAVRVGLPTPGGKLLAAARHRGYPVLLSANAFARRIPLRLPWGGTFRHFRLPDPHQFDGMDVALDSAGFMAATQYREFQWTVEQYMDLVAAYPWTWWAAMDYCCEPEVANDRPERLLRMAATVLLYRQCLNAARARGLSPPVPVIQGWTPTEYRQSIRWLNLDPWPSLVGVGSVCRRAVEGPNGILEIVEALDKALPAGVRLHLFGMNRAALAPLANHPRVASTDSMAWDAHARRQRPTGRDVAFRIQCMERWMRRQNWRLNAGARGAGLQARLSLPCPAGDLSFEAHALESLALEWAELVLSNDVTYLDAVWYMKADAPHLIAMVRQRCVTPTSLTALEEIFPGLSLTVAHPRPMHSSLWR